MMERLNKVLARAGLASRRGADRLIEQGRVSVNGKIVHELGVRVDPGVDSIKVDEKRIPSPPTSHSYFLLNKPRGCVTTLSDPEGRPTIEEFLRGIRVRVFPVGRLDFNTEGLLLLTDDGDLARDLMHPRSRVPKTYLAKVRGMPDTPTLARLRRGIRIEGGVSLPARVEIAKPGGNATVEITVVEGRKHQVRQMLQAVGHPVVKLRRIRYGGLALTDLPSGQLRRLGPEEVERLRRAVRTGASRGRPRQGPGSR